MLPHDSSEDVKPARWRTALKNLACLIAVAFLGALLAFQIVLLTHGGWEIPKGLVVRLHEELDRHGWSASYSSLALHPFGIISANDLRLTRAGEEEPIALAAHARVRVDLRELIQGRVFIQTVRLEGGQIDCPARISPTGVSEQIMAGTRLIAHQKEGGWEIETFNGRMHTLTFKASGFFPVLPPREREPGEFHRLLNVILPRLMRERLRLDQAINPHAQVRFGPTGDSLLAMSATVTADTVHSPEGLLVEELTIAGGWSFDGSHWIIDGLSAEAKSMRLAPSGNTFLDTALARLQAPVPEAILPLQASKVRARFFWDTAGELISPLLPTRAELNFDELRSPMAELNSLTLTGEITGPHSASLDLFSLFADGIVSASLSGDWSQGSARADARLLATPNAVMQNPRLADFGFKRDVFFHRAPSIHASAEVRNWAFHQAEARALSGPVEIDGISFDRAWVTAGLRPGQFLVPEMILAFGDFEATGDYEFNLVERDYRLFFGGSFRPLHISPWFGSWWVPFWSHFGFPGGPMRGDVDIRGLQGRPETVSVTGSVQADDFSIRGVPFRSAAGHLLVLDHYVDFFRLNLVRDEGRASGEFQYYGDHDTGNLQRLSFLVDSTLDPVDVGRLFGEGGARFVAPFRFESPPMLRMQGMIHPPERAGATRVTLSGKADAPLTYQGIPLEHLQVEAQVEGEEWKLEELRLGIAGGNASGAIRKWQEENQERLDLDLRVRWVDLERVSRILAEWPAANSEEAANVQRNDFRGRMDMRLKAVGNYGDFRTFEGEGDFQIREAELAELHLLGLLSRLLSGTPLAFTSLQFSEAASTFRIEQERVHFPDLRLAGPASALRASGNYLLDRQALDFSVKLFLLKESRIPLVSFFLSPLLDPLAHATEIRLTGPASDPAWRFVLGPRNLLGTLSGSSAANSSEETADR
jgi:hypothetical protein